jgi:ABC-type glycerol-3-phosphate transport system substrate-binding protein
MKAKIVMMMVIVFAGLAAMASPSFAHHSASAFDLSLSSRVVLKDAVVTEFVWRNPHPLIKADYTDEQGNVQHWTMEMGSTVSSQLIGWTRTALAPDDVVTLYIWPAKSGKHVGRLNKVELADGTVLRDSQHGADDGGRADVGARH